MKLSNVSRGSAVFEPRSTLEEICYTHRITTHMLHWKAYI